MGVVNVAQFGRMAQDNNGHDVPVVLVPADSSENVTSSGTSAQSTALEGIIRIATDTTVRIKFGTNPTATATGIRLVADTVEYFSIPSATKVAVIDE